jgi:hypothetical protein
VHGHACDADCTTSSGVFAISHSVTSTTRTCGTLNPTRSANCVASNSLASTRTCCGLFWNFTT